MEIIESEEQKEKYTEPKGPAGQPYADHTLIMRVPEGGEKNGTERIFEK